MFEDFEQKKIEEDEDSESWSYSYPSYSRFTFTGKTKSRLGRSTRQNQQPNNKDEMKDNVNVTSEFGSSSSQVPNTPNHGGNWLRGDTLTTSTQITQPGTGQDHQSSVNDSGVDVSSQSNFFFSLKNDSVQNNVNCKRNLPFSTTLFKAEESQKNTKTEQNQLIKLPPISNLMFPLEENKENTQGEKLSEDFNNKDKIPFDPSWSQFKKICDGNIPFAPLTANPLQNNEPVIKNRTNFGRTTNELFNPLNIFNSMGVKENSDQYNTPLDLSSGDSLTNKTFNRSITGGSEHTPVAAEITSSTYPQTLTPQQTKENPINCDVRMKQKNYSEDINSILPAFLVPKNKNKYKDSCLNDEKLKTSLPITSNSVLNLNSDSKLMDPLQTANRNVLTSQSAVTQSHNFQESNLKGPSKTDSHNLNSQNYPEKQSSNNITDLHTYKSSSTIPNPTHVVNDGHMKYSSREPFGQIEQLYPDPSKKCNEVNIFPPQLNENPFSRRESWVGLQTQVQPLANQFSNLKTKEEESKITVPNTCNKSNKNVFIEEIAKPQNVLQVESIKEINQPEDLVINNIIELQTKKQPTESTLDSSTDIANKKCVSEGNGLVSFQNPLSIQRNNISSNNPVFETKTELSNMKSALISENPNPNCTPHQHSLVSQSQELKHCLDSVAISQTVEPAQVMKEKVNQKMYNQQTQLPLSEVPLIKQPATYEPFLKQNSAQVNPTSSQNQMLQNTRQHVVATSQRLQGQGFQKTYLAPHAPIDQRNKHNFPHVKPELPQQNNRPHLAAPKKSQNVFKMPGAQGLLSRGNSELYVNDKMYTILSMLGRGGSSEVYQVLDSRSSKLMAVKCVDLSMVDKTIADGYLNEIDLLSKLQGCASVIRMFDYEYVEENKILYVVMEKGDTDLSQLIRDISKTKKISMSMIIYYWTEMLNAVKDIHEQGIIHSDLKPANFLLVSGRLKLIDFGIASSQGDMTSVVKEVTTGTWNYMSPEAIRNTSSSGKGFKITYKSDVWSLGCILYNLVYGKTPFSHITNTWGKLQAIADPNHRIEFPEVGAPVVLAGALRSCFHRDPVQRPTVAELLRLQYHATCDTNHIGRQLLTILPADWWTKVSHLFPDLKPSQEDNNSGSTTA